MGDPDMTDPVLLVDERGGILEIVFNRPQKLNAINQEMADRLFALALDFRARDDLRVMLIRATGKYFSAGTDLTDVGMPDPQDSSSRARTSMFDEFEAIEKPIVVAHHAACLGGALEMSLSCDFRLAAASARYALPEIQIGVLPGSGGTSRLTRIVGPHWARWMAMVGKSVDSQRALMIGLVHDVFPDDEFDARVWSFCEELTRLPREALSASKLAIELVADLDRQQARNVERLTNSVLFLGREHKDLVAAMRQKLSAGKGSGKGQAL
jgi:enoyl-CoA hydratase